jgi:hypothetical protein
LTSLPVLVFDIGGRDASVFSHDSFIVVPSLSRFPDVWEVAKNALQEE